MNPTATSLSPLADINCLRWMTHKSDAEIYAMTDGADLINGSYLWVWNVATNPVGEIRDLRWWTGEALAQAHQSKLYLEEVIDFIVPKKRREFPAGEVRKLLLISSPTLMELRAELMGDLRTGGSFFPRQALVDFFIRRWLGNRNQGGAHV